MLKRSDNIFENTKWQFFSAVYIEKNQLCKNFWTKSVITQTIIKYHKGLQKKYVKIVLMAKRDKFFTIIWWFRAVFMIYNERKKKIEKITAKE